MHARAHIHPTTSRFLYTLLNYSNRAITYGCVTAPSVHKYPPTQTLALSGILFDNNSLSLSRIVTTASPSSPIVTLLGSDEEFITTLKISVSFKIPLSFKEILKTAFVIPAGTRTKYGPLK